MTLGRLPTPLERFARLDARLGAELWVKREDQSDTFLCGNKARKLAPILERAIREGADTLVVAGSAQSNLCRVATLSAARAGLRTALVLGVDDPARPAPIAGNLLLAKLAGASVHWVRFTELLERAPVLLAARAAELTAQGRKPFIVPLGANVPDAFVSVSQIVDEIAAALPPGETTIVFPVASGGTAAALLFGLARLGLPWRAVGVITTGSAEETASRDRIARFVTQAASGTTLAAPPLTLLDGSGAGYARSTPQELDALVQLAHEGLLLDETYNVKAMSVALREGASLGSRIVYLNTGGHFSLFAAGAPLVAAIDRWESQ